jgi:Fe-S cluster biogenesis protein NfuA
MKPSISQIEKAIDSIRPYLLADGGDVKVLEVDEEGIVKLELLGSCSNCRMSSMTLKAGVEQAIMQAVPEVTSVVAINSMVESNAS